MLGVTSRAATPDTAISSSCGSTRRRRSRQTSPLRVMAPAAASCSIWLLEPTPASARYLSRRRGSCWSMPSPPTERAAPIQPLSDLLDRVARACCSRSSDRSIGHSGIRRSAPRGSTTARNRRRRSKCASIGRDRRSTQRTGSLPATACDRDARAQSSGRDLDRRGETPARAAIADGAKRDPTSATGRVSTIRRLWRR